MKLMHTKLPDFIKKMYVAASKEYPQKTMKLKGLENLRSAKLQSLRTGRIENAVAELAHREDIEHIEVDVLPRIPETMHTVVVKGQDRNGTTKKVILEVINILHPTEETEFDGCDDIEDRRPPLGLH
ncbi:MAG: hypothetical protein PUC44_00055 [Eubacteriales bacterium]|nr:hypothetical protein [Eubacteriales bacterium]